MAPTAPVLAVLVCHDGETWLPETLGALGRLTVGPRRVVAVDTGSRDSTSDLLRSSNRVDVVLDLPRDTPFGTAVAAAVADADRRWGRSEGSDRGPGDWLWVLHDDAAPEPSCLDVLLSVAEASPSAAMLGPLQLDWDDPRLVVEAGLSTDASGHRQTGIGSDELDLGQFATNSEVLAVGSAGALVRRREWDALGGYDSAFGLLREDLDLGWRINRAGGLVLCVPSARLHHARAVSVGTRGLDARGTDGGLRTTDRRNGMATVLVNGTAAAYAIGLVRLPLLAVLRAIGFLLLRRPRAANAELGAMGRLVADLGDLREARRRRRPEAGSGDVRGLLTSRTTRLRNAVSGGLTSIVRNRVRDDLDLGRLPDWAARPSRAPVSAAAASAEGPEAGALLVGQGALPAGATAPKRSSRRKAGLRRPGGESVAVSLAGPVASGEAGPTELIGARSGRHRTAEPDPEAATALVGIPDPRDAPAAEPDPRLVVVPVTPGRVLRELLLAPPLLMVLALTAVSLLAQRSRLGLDLAGGRLRVLPELGPLWAGYLAEWHPVAGGTAAPAPAALAVVGVVGGLLWPVAGSSGPAVAVSLLLLGALPLAGLSAYVATRPLRVGRVLRALAASVYALLGITGAAVAQGRLDGVVVVVLLPLVLAGVAAVLRGSRTAAGDEGTRGRRTSWWSAAAGTSLLLAVVSAFAPLVHLMVLVVVVIGFVAVPAPAGAAKRRAVALAAVVVLPVLLLLPWPSMLLRAPQVLLHGTGSPVAERFASTLDVLSLDPGGVGSLPVVGLIVLVAAVGGALLAPRRTMVPGLGVMLLGIVTAGIVGTVSLAPLSGGDPRPGWTGPALAFAACGALWSLLALVAEARVTPLGTLVTGRSGPRHRPAPRRLGDPAIDLGPDGVLSRVGGGARSTASRLGTAFSSRLRVRASAASTGRARGIAVPVAAAAAVALAVCAVLLGTGGALAARPAPVLDAQLAARLAGSGATVVEVGLAPRADGPGFALDADATRRAGAELSRYGDDDLVPVGAAPARLTRDVTALLSGDPATVQAGAAELAAAGTAAVVLPDAGVADRAVSAGAPLLTPAAPASDGRTVLTIGLPVAGAVVLEPPVSDDATDAKAAPRRPSGIGILPASPPDVGVLISPGADRRLVVLAAERESGWTATVGGAPADIVPAWGHLVGVPVPAGGGPVVVTRDTTLRGLLLLLQLALVLFTVLSALPSRTRLDERPGEGVGGHR